MITFVAVLALSTQVSSEGLGWMKPNSPFAPVFSAKGAISVRAIYPSKSGEARVGKIAYAYAGESVPLTLTRSRQFLSVLQKTMTSAQSLCIFHPDHAISIPVGKEVATVVTCFHCKEVVLTFRGKSESGMMGYPGTLKEFLDEVVPDQDRRTATIREAFGTDIEQLLKGATSATIESSALTDGDGSLAYTPRALNLIQRRWLTSVLGISTSKDSAPRGGPVVTVRFDSEPPRAIAFDFKKHEISVDGNHVDSPLDWNLLRDCLIGP